jgi:cell division protein ZapE
MSPRASTPLALYQARVASGALSPDPAQAAAAARLDALAQELKRWNPEGWFNQGEPPRGLYLWGAVGRGKSMLMDLFFETAPIKRKQRVHFHQFMQAQHAFMRTARAKTGDSQDQVIIQAAKDITDKVRLLCFDELQVTDIADAMIVGRLFEHLFAEDVIVVATSNRHPRDLYKNGLNRQLFLPFISLLEGKLEAWELGAAQDYRFTGLMSAPVYYAPAGPASEEALEAAWVRLTQGATPRPLTLTVQGRSLDIPRHAAGVAWMGFDDLCGRPLGPADYLALADQVDTLILERIPRLTPAMREEAARFRTLIDALYEAKVKLIASAEAEPVALYPAGDQSFEFERTASRLMEMRTEAYLALPRRDAEWRRGVVE